MPVHAAAELECIACAVRGNQPFGCEIGYDLVAGLIVFDEAVGALHIDLQQVLNAVGLPDTPENRDTTTRVLRYLFGGFGVPTMHRRHLPPEEA